jgi:hypothetical protein
VSRETWDAAQAKLAERRVNRSYVRDAGYALTGLLYCGHCRMKMKGTHCGCRAANGKVYSYRRYICKTAIANGSAGCRLYSIRESYLLPFLVKKLQEDYLAPEKVAQLEVELRRRLEARRNGGSLAEVEGLRRRLAAVDDEIKTATQNVLRAKSNIDLLNDALTALRGERERLAAGLSDAEARRGPELDIEGTVKKAVDRLRTLAERLQEVDPKRLREVLRQMFVRVDLYYQPLEGRTKRSPFRLEKGVAQLRPQVQFDSCASSSPPCSAQVTNALMITFTADDLGIPRPGRRKPAPSEDSSRWREEDLRLLGTMPDAEVAAKIGRSASGVRQKRERLGIPNPEPGWWTDEEIALLGTAPDGDLAQQLKRTAGSVRQKRQTLGIPRHSQDKST